MEAALFILLKLLLVLILVLLNGFFVAAEFALVKVRDSQLESLIAQGQGRARIVRRLVQNLDAYLSACQLGITLASLGLGWVGEPVFSALLSPVLTWLNIESETLRHYLSFAVGFTALTFLHITAGEQAPKWLAIQKPLPTSLWVGRPLLWFSRVSYPFIWVLNNASLWMLRKLGIQPVSESETVHSEEELRLVFATAQKQRGAAKHFGRDIVLNALDLRQRIAREVMRPRQEIVGLSTGASIAECLDVAERTRYSRFPLCEQGDIDKTLGVVHFKDLFAMRAKAQTGADLSAVVRKLIYVPETARLEKLLHLFLDRKLHFAIVVDEYGFTRGMVTLENILEELVGQIQDEFDQEIPLLQQIDEKTWTLSGSLPLHDLAELTGERLLAEGVTTVSGWVTERLGGFPKEGDVIPLGRFDLRVQQLAGLRVSELRLTQRLVL